MIWCAVAPLKLLSILVAVLISPIAACWSIVAGVEKLTGVFAWMQTVDTRWTRFGSSHSIYRAMRT